MSESGKGHKQRRAMTDTEYRGYRRGHESVEEPAARETLKAKKTQADSVARRRRVKRRVDHALGKGDTSAVEDAEYRSQKAERAMRGARGRTKRKKLIEGYEETKENTGRP